MKTAKAILLVALVEVLLIITFHQTLIDKLADRQIVASLLAAGEHIPKPDIATAIAFVVVRLMAVLVLPGIILYDFWMALTSCWQQRNEIS